MVRHGEDLARTPPTPKTQQRVTAARTIVRTPACLGVGRTRDGSRQITRERHRGVDSRTRSTGAPAEPIGLTAATALGGGFAQPMLRALQG